MYGLAVRVLSNHEPYTTLVASGNRETLGEERGSDHWGKYQNNLSGGQPTHESTPVRVQPDELV